MSVSTLKRRFSKFFSKKRWPSKSSRKQGIRERNFRHMSQREQVHVCNGSSAMHPHHKPAHSKAALPPSIQTSNSVHKSRANPLSSTPMQRKAPEFSVRCPTSKCVPSSATPTFPTRHSAQFGAVPSPTSSCRPCASRISILRICNDSNCSEKYFSPQTMAHLSDLCQAQHARG